MDELGIGFIPHVVQLVVHQTCPDRVRLGQQLGRLVVVWVIQSRGQINTTHKRSNAQLEVNVLQRPTCELNGDMEQFLASIVVEPPNIPLTSHSDKRLECHNPLRIRVPIRGVYRKRYDGFRAVSQPDVGRVFASESRQRSPIAVQLAGNRAAPELVHYAIRLFLARISALLRTSLHCCELSSHRSRSQRSSGRPPAPAAACVPPRSATLMTPSPASSTKAVISTVPFHIFLTMCKMRASPLTCQSGQFPAPKLGTGAPAAIQSLISPSPVFRRMTRWSSIETAPTG